MAGYNYTLTCTATLIEGMSDTPSIWWTHTDDQLVSSGGDIILHDPITTGLSTILTLYFDPIRIMDGGMYICVASVPSPALTAPLNSSTAYDIIVLSSKSYLFCPHNKSHLFLLQPTQFQSQSQTSLIQIGGQSMLLVHQCSCSVLLIADSLQL